MAKRVVLHIGSMKSGTSFIQNVLGSNREALSEHGIDFALPRWVQQVRAVQELAGHGGPAQPPLAPEGPWSRLVDAVRQHPGTSVVSMEFLAPRSPQKIGLIREAFDCEIDVVLTGRDLGRNIVAMWLEDVQNRSSVTWEHYLSSVRAERGDDKVSNVFWRHQGLADIAAKWSQAFGDDHFTLITVPQPGSPNDLLWRRFAEVLDVPPDAFSLDVRANRSIGLATALTLRDLNEQLSADSLAMSRPDGARYYDLLVKHLLTKRGLATRGAEEPRLGLDERWVRRRGEAEVKQLRKQGCRVIGDLDELVPRPVPGIAPAQVSASDRHAATLAALTRMVEVSQSREEKLREQTSRLRRRVRRLKRREAKA